MVTIIVPEPVLHCIQTEIAREKPGIFILPIFVITNFPPLFLMYKMLPFICRLGCSAALSVPHFCTSAVAARVEVVQQRQQLIFLLGYLSDSAGIRSSTKVTFNPVDSPPIQV